MQHIKSFKLLILKAIMILSFSCVDGDSNDYDAPSCINDKIKAIKKEAVRNPPTQVWKWEVDGEKYYYISSDCCDQFNFLFNESCGIVCAPDGGFSGNGDGKCPDFMGEIVKTLIWEDERN